MNRSLLNQQYKLLRKIATGSMGEILLARQVGVAGFRREVVLKRIHRRLNDHPKAVRMFLDEARLAASLNHPAIVQIFDIYEEDGSYFIVMERIRGSNLRDLAETTTRQGRMIPMELSINIIIQVLEGLRYAHQFRDETGRALKIVHRDICPTNILISFDGAVKLVDFGIARAEDQLLQESGGPSGKFAYMAPEVIMGEQADARSDLVSVGILLYELTVGQRLFRAPSLEAMRRIMNDPIPPPTFSRAGYPVDLEIIVMRALERDPADRFPSAEEMLEELERFAFDTGMRISRLRLGRFVREILGVTTRDALRVPEPEVSEEIQEGTAQEDLDFDHSLFEEHAPAERDLPRKEEVKGERSSGVMAAIQQANEAIAELVADDEEEEGETIELPSSSQATRRADTVPPTQETTGLREGSALIITDDMIESEEEPSSVVTAVTVRAIPDDTQRTRPRAEAPVDIDDEEDLDLDMEMPRRATDVKEEAIEPPEPSADLKDALAEISEELRALEQSDMQREAAIGKLLRGAGQSTEQPSELVSSLLDRPATPAEVESDELERVDHPARRVLDDLELSDLDDELKLEPEEETTSLDDAIELDSDDVELIDDELDEPTIPDLPPPKRAVEAPVLRIKPILPDVSAVRPPRPRSRARSKARPQRKRRRGRRTSTRRSGRPSLSRARGRRRR